MAEQERGSDEAVAAPGPKAPTITRAIKVELAKPLTGTWEEVGKRLRVLRSVSHRLVNAVTFEWISALRDKRKETPLVAIKQEIADIEAHTKNELYKELNIPSAIIDAVCRRGMQSAKRFWKARGQERMPSARFGAPIYLRDRDASWELTEDAEGRVSLGVRLTGGRTGKTFFLVRPGRAVGWERIRCLVKDGVKRGDCKIVYDERHRKKDGGVGKWFAVLTYTEAAPEPKVGAVTMALHRGQRNFLTWATTDGYSGVIMRGNALLAQRRALEARRRSMMGSKFEQGAGARGRGRQRAFETYEKLGDKIARCCTTACQQAAARAMSIAEVRGAAVLVREDYGGIAPSDDRNERRFIDRFPLYQLGQTIDWAAKKTGRSVATTPAEFISTKCPRCAGIDPKNHVHRTGIFRCRACGFERKADMVAVLHLLRNSGADMTTWDERFARELRLADSARAAEARADMDEAERLACKLAEEAMSDV